MDRRPASNWVCTGRANRKGREDRRGNGGGEKGRMKGRDEKGLGTCSTQRKNKSTSTKREQ
jgi:hypothetical protein